MRGAPLARQVPLTIIYEGAKLGAGYRLDMVVGGLFVIEIKAVEALTRLRLQAPPDFKHRLSSTA